MTKLMRYLALLTLIVGGWTSISRAADVDNPRFKAWSSYKIGSSETLAGKIAAMGMEIDVSIQNTLVESADDHVDIETVVTTNVMGHDHTGPPRRHTINAKAPEVDIKQDGEEDVAAMGRTFKCKVMEADNDMVAGPRDAPPTGKAKFWVAGDVPGGCVKVAVNGKDRQGNDVSAEYLLTAYEAK